MKYKYFRLASDPKVIGVNNGIYQMKIDEKLYGSENINDQLVYKFVSKENALEEYIDRQRINSLDMILLKRAKLTDFMSYSPKILNGIFAASEACQTVLSNFKLDNPKKIPLTLWLNGESRKERYELFLYPKIQPEVFNFEESIIYTGNDLLGKTYHKISDLEHFQKFAEANSIIAFEKVVVKAEAFDIMPISRVGLFMSERLVQACLDAGLTGLNIPTFGPTLLVE